VVAAVNQWFNLPHNFYYLPEEHVIGKTDRMQVNAHEVIVITYVLPVIAMEVIPADQNMCLRLETVVQLSRNILVKCPAGGHIH
jgi:hypothetical protein